MTLKVEELLTALAQKLGVTTDRILGAYRAQIPLYIMYEAGYVLFSVLLLFGCRWLWCSVEYDEKAYDHDGFYAARVGSLVAATFALLMTHYNVYWLLTAIYNPDYYIVRMIMEQLK